MSLHSPNSKNHAHTWFENSIDSRWFARILIRLFTLNTAAAKIQRNYVARQSSRKSAAVEIQLVLPQRSSWISCYAKRGRKRFAHVNQRLRRARESLSNFKPTFVHVLKQ